MKEMAETYESEMKIPDHAKLHALLDEWLSDLERSPIVESEDSVITFSAHNAGDFCEDEETPLYQFYVERKRTDMI